MIKKRFYALVFLSLIIMAAPLNLLAYNGYSAHTHQGFYLNFQLGAGYGETTMEESGDADFTLSGPTGVARIKAGGAITENFIIYGVYGVFNIEDPKIEYGDYSGTADGLSLTYYDLGIGICYYFMPINIYISADIASSKGELTGYGFKGETESGVSFTFSLGKEWWVSDNWGLGVALILSGASMDDGPGSDAEITHSFVGVAFTATYN